MIRRGSGFRASRAMASSLKVAPHDTPIAAPSVARSATAAAPAIPRLCASIFSGIDSPGIMTQSARPKRPIISARSEAKSADGGTSVILTIPSSCALFSARDTWLLDIPRLAAICS
ncbi:MAG: hypothetical protein BWY85_01016 [Firmicutes bacterium ADurb.Bin506]|nr:MAG: hypothetical protein BWY85_01016 [Firmicutes bacterium ADurb.Bin506]